MRVFYGITLGERLFLACQKDYFSVLQLVQKLFFDVLDQLSVLVKDQLLGVVDHNQAIYPSFVESPGLGLDLSPKGKDFRLDCQAKSEHR
jgi:hypothetical protein